MRLYKNWCIIAVIVCCLIIVYKNRRRWIKNFATFVLGKLGWSINNTTDPMLYKKAVVIFAPHTSNWDFMYGMLFKFIYPDASMGFAIKKEWMFFPLSYVMHHLGAIPIDRFRKSVPSHYSTVEYMTKLFQTSDQLCLLISPEGTRKRVERWRTGFYRVAQNAGVPIILGYLDYRRKEIGFGPVYYPTDDLEKDLQEIMAYYRNKCGKYPDQGVV